jgi:Phage tail lysozyme
VADQFDPQAVNLVAQELIRRGVKPVVAAGAVAGLMGESGPNLSPTSFNTKDPGGGSGGIGQWNRGRLIGGNGMLAFAAANGVPGLDVNNPQDAKKVPLATQAQYLGHELDTTYSGVLRGLQSVSTGQEGLTTWVNNYEDPADKAGAIAQRKQYIQPVSSVLAGGDAAAAPGPVDPSIIAHGGSGPPLPVPAAAPIGTTINTPVAGAASPIPGMGPQQGKDFLAGLQKMGVANPDDPSGQGGGGEPVRPSPIMPAQPLHLPNPAQAAQTFGQTLSSMRAPQWSSAAPGSQSPVYASAGEATSPGTSINSMQQLQQMQAMQQMRMGMSGMGGYGMAGMGMGLGGMMGMGYPYGGYGYG